MPSSLNLQSTVNWCAPFINYQPLTIGGLEPAVTIANMILQTVLGPPFCWRWNRNTIPFVLANNVQDYVEAVSDFGFIEKAWIQSANGLEIIELEIKNALAATKDKARPAYVAAQSDDNAGNITFRFGNSLPQEAFAATILYQKKPVLMSSLASFWSPLPDELEYIYNWGFLALCSILVNDARFPIFNQKFTSHLLGAQDGLDEMQRNIFLGNWEQITKQLQRAAQQAQQGTAARQG